MSLFVPLEQICGSKTPRKRSKKRDKIRNFEEWQLRYLRTGQLPYEDEVKNKFAVLEFCWSSGAGLAWLQIKDHVAPGEFPYAEENFKEWRLWRAVREALEKDGDAE